MSLPSFLTPIDHQLQPGGHQRVFCTHKSPLEDVYGLWWSADSAQPPEGNPGIVDFYIPFLSDLRERNPRWAVLAHSHIGHTPGFASSTSTSRCGLSFQIQSATDAIDLLKLQFRRVVIIGHSVGCYISLQALKQRPADIDGLFLLFPTVCHIADTPNGRTLSWLFNPPLPRVVSALTYVAGWIPTGLLRLVQSGYPTEQLSVVKGLLGSPTAAFSALTMANDEMKQIQDLDAALLEEHRHRIWMYFAEEDGWVGDQREVILHSFHPEPGSVRIVHDVHGIPHAFCIS
ncbi:hypothetical protein BD626DRAFT_546363 [Schizophyllum amplum]|uniref:Alpha/Beta hydrolase protein n=1 Tax=Schizophyllum amplum TaxID=97359 RepID=A0A550CMF5_9AGAR|nr:hypothetical protein BD626DRAFT_546363 [Auriculariopsis ampla]